MKIVVDMNLSPEWCDALAAAGFEARHWMTMGAHDAPDHVVMATSLAYGSVVLTHDLDFSAILASTGAVGPSVVQLRTSDVSVAACSASVIATLRTYADLLRKGAILSIDARSARVRALPLHGAS